MAGGKSLQFDNDLLKLILNGVGIPGIADNTASAPLAAYYLSLHTADPGAGGNQNTNEAAYPGYTRMPVARSAQGFTINGAIATLTAAVTFPACQAFASTETETFAAVGIALAGTGKILYRGPITPNLAVGTAMSPQLTSGTALTES